MLTKLHVERFGPVFIAAVAAGLYWWKGGSPSGDVAKELLAALLSAAAISAGFLTTALTVLLPIGSSPIGRQLKRRQRLKDLFAYVRSAIYSCILLAVVCVIGLYRYEPSLGLERATATATVAIAVHSAAAFLRILEILIKVLPQMGEAEDLNG